MAPLAIHTYSVDNSIKLTETEMAQAAMLLTLGNACGISWFSSVSLVKCQNSMPTSDQNTTGSFHILSS
jgi:hypothetical protein